MEEKTIVVVESVPKASVFKKKRSSLKWVSYTHRVFCTKSNGKTSYLGVLWTNKYGQPLQSVIQRFGEGRFSTAHGRTISPVEPEVYCITVWNGDVEIKQFSAFTHPSGVVIPVDGCPRLVQKAAETWVSEANCYHCKCLQKHLGEVSRSVNEFRTQEGS